MDFTSGLSHESTERRTVSESYEIRHGKRLEHAYEAEELSLVFSTGSED